MPERVRAGGSGAPARRSLRAPENAGPDRAARWPAPRSSLSSPGIEPALQQHRRRGAIDSLPGLAAVHALLTQSTLSLASSQPFVAQLDGQARCMRQIRGKAPRLSRLRPFGAVQPARDAHDEYFDLLAFCEFLQGGHEFSQIASVEVWPGMREQPELIGHGHSDAHFAQINADGAHD